MLDIPLKFNKKILILIFYLIYLSFFGSLGLNSLHLKNINGDFLSILNVIRFFTPFILSVMMICFSIYIFERKKILTNLIFLFFILMFVPFLIEVRNPSFMEIYLGTLSIGCVSFFHILQYLKITVTIKRILALSIVVSGLSGLALTILNSHNLNLFDQNFYYFSNVYDKFLGGYFPRTTGISRSLALLSLLLFFLYNTQTNYKKLILLSVVILNFFVWKMQSRGAIFCYLSAFVFFLLFFNKLNFKFIFKNLLLFLLLPFFLSQYTFTPKNYKIINEKYFAKNIISKQKDLSNNIDNKQNVLKNYLRKNQITNYNNTGEIRFFSKFPLINDISGSGRVLLWKQALQASNNKLFGHGIQGDRFLLKNNSMYGNNVSNGFIYAFISGGYGSLAILIFFVGIFFFYLFKLFILNKVYLKDMESYRSLSIIIIIFFFIRILFENSFVIFSLDLLVILPCMFTLLDKYELKKNEG